MTIEEYRKTINDLTKYYNNIVNIDLSTIDNKEEYNRMMDELSFLGDLSPMLEGWGYIDKDNNVLYNPHTLYSKIILLRDRIKNITKIHDPELHKLQLRINDISYKYFETISNKSIEYDINIINSFRNNLVQYANSGSKPDLNFVYDILLRILLIIYTSNTSETTTDRVFSELTIELNNIMTEAIQNIDSNSELYKYIHDNWFTEKE